MTPQWANGRDIKERIFIEARLVLETPTHIGSGDEDGVIDMPLLMHEIDHAPLLMGSSVAGALRGYLEHAGMSCQASSIFGSGDSKKSMPSLIMIDDSIGRLSSYPSCVANDVAKSKSTAGNGKPPSNVISTELRDGVAINLDTGTADYKAKYDIELLPAGTEFTLGFELLLLDNDADNDILKYVTTALKALEKGKIALGKRKRRGFGKCHVASWKVNRYDVTTANGLIKWLEKDISGMGENTDITKLLEVECIPVIVNNFVIEADFGLSSPMLIRSSSAEENSPDFVQLHSNRNGKPVPVISGTSLAGALRARAYKIVNTIDTIDENKESVVNDIFGSPREDPSKSKDKTERVASRLWVNESEIKNAKDDLVLSRIKIDRFTGGVSEGALFSEQPSIGKEDTIVHIKLVLEDPKDGEKGLLLLILKDLWTSDITVGGGRSVGRGRLKGISAKLEDGNVSWEIIQKGESLSIKGDIPKLESFVDVLWKEGGNNGK